MKSLFAGPPARRLLFAGLLLVACIAIVVQAQTPAPAPAPGSISTTASGALASGGIDAATGALPTFADLFMFSPWINGLIAALSVLSLGMFIFLLLSVTSSQLAPASLTDEVTRLAFRKKFEAISDLCRAQRRTFTASIYQRLADNASKDHGTLMDIIETEGKRRAELIWNRISYLSDIANVAPMLGLLGTVLGMIKAFFLLEQQVGSVESAALSRGVGEAMSTTMFGLVVAIVTLVFYSIIKARATTALGDAEAAVQAVADHMSRAPGSDSGNDPAHVSASGGQ